MVVRRSSSARVVNPGKLEALEPRRLFSVAALSKRAPSNGVTNTDRQMIIDNWQKGKEKNHLQAALNADIAANDGGTQFDADLLSYMTTQFDANSHYFFQPSDVAADIQLIQDPNDLYGQPYKKDWESLMDTARLELSHNFYGVQLGSTINWIDNPKQLGSNTSFLDELNQMDQMVDFATAYRLQPMAGYTDAGDPKWVAEIQSELVSWEQQEPPLANPNDYGNDFPNWWLLDTSFRTLNLEETYALLIGTPAFTPALNTLFIKEFMEHGEFLSTVTPKLPTSNWDVSQGAALSELADMFPEFAGAAKWQSVAVNNLLVPSLQQQFFADGGQVEQSPGYAKEVLGLFGDVYYLNHDGWPSDAKKILRNAANAYYQVLEPDGTQPALGDTVTAISADVLAALQLELGTDWQQAKLHMNDVFKLGAEAAIGTLGDPANPTLTGRPQVVVQPDSGNYIMRSTEDDADTRELIFQAGPTCPPGDAHAHFDLFSFDLYGYGQPLIADPGVNNYVPGPQRTRLISTPAANTLSINGENNAFVTPADASKMIHVEQSDEESDSYQVTAQQTAYQGVAGVNGNPVLTRSIWYDDNDTYMVVDWANASATNTYTTAYNLVGPTAAGPGHSIYTTNSDGNNVMVVPVLQPGQKTNSDPTTVFTGGATAATQFSISQKTASALFASIIITYQGSTPPDVTAQWAKLPRGNKAGILEVLEDGVVTESASFSANPAAAPGSGRHRTARPSAPAATPTSPWSTQPISLFAQPQQNSVLN